MVVKASCIKFDKLRRCQKQTETLNGSNKPLLNYNNLLILSLIWRQLGCLHDFFFFLKQQRIPCRLMYNAVQTIIDYYDKMFYIFAFVKFIKRVFSTKKSILFYLNFQNGKKSNNKNTIVVNASAETRYIFLFRKYYYIPYTCTV